MANIEKYLKIDKWYHGTTLSGWKKLFELGVKADFNIDNELDFGFGFYLTPKEEQAKYYIENVLKYSLEGLPVKDYQDQRTPVIIEFTFCPMDWYETSQYAFKFFPSYDNEFAEFVFHNRINNIDGLQQHNYHIIYGVMSDSTPTIQIQKYKQGEITHEKVLEALKKSTSKKQLSLHIQEICDKIVPSRAYCIDPRKELNVDEYYSNR